MRKFVSDLVQLFKQTTFLSFFVKQLRLLKLLLFAKFVHFLWWNVISSHSLSKQIQREFRKSYKVVFSIVQWGKWTVNLLKIYKKLSSRNQSEPHFVYFEWFILFLIEIILIKNCSSFPFIKHIKHENQFCNNKTYKNRKNGFDDTSVDNFPWVFNVVLEDFFKCFIHLLF